MGGAGWICGSGGGADGPAWNIACPAPLVGVISGCASRGSSVRPSARPYPSGSEAMSSIPITTVTTPATAARISTERSTLLLGGSSTTGSASGSCHSRSGWGPKGPGPGGCPKIGG